MSTDDVTTRFRLSASASGLSVDVGLRPAHGRWVASAAVEGRSTTGVGSTARHALRAALASLDRQAVDGLLADPVLFGVSAEILRLSRLGVATDGGA